ncbi:unnamed protein product [Amoebophrya sp. A25]|nr:unnamed protein product [Amoebophrya sp. A25]|eukprot:GSA25T00013123001.1
MERYLRRSRDNGGVALLYEQPNLRLSCHAGVRDALFLLQEQGAAGQSALTAYLREQLLGDLDHDRKTEGGGEVETHHDEQRYLSEWIATALSDVPSLESLLTQYPFLYEQFCLPRLSVTTPLLSQLGYLRLALLAGVDAGYLTLHHFFIKSGVFDFFWEADINVLPEFYQSHQLKRQLLFLKASPPALRFLDDVLSMLYKFPFSVFARVLPRLIFGAHVPDTVVSISFGEDRGQFRTHLPYVHFLDAENAFATGESWYGDWGNLVLFELEPHTWDAQGRDVLRELYKGEREHDLVGTKAAFTTTSASSDIGEQGDVAESEEQWEFRDHVSAAMRRAQKPLSPRRPVIDLYRDMVERFDSMPEERSKVFMPDGWRVLHQRTLRGFAAQLDHVFVNAVQRAKHVCMALGPDLCAGVVCDSPTFERCTIREGKEAVSSSSVEGPTTKDGATTNNEGATETPRKPVAEEIWVQTLFSPEETLEGEDPPQSVALIPPGMRFLKNEWMHHVNFAMNCCAEDQKRSSDTALEVGLLHSSEMQNETHLTEEFLTRNHALLTYYRHPALTVHKTPTAKRGYYVWKAFIFLQALEAAPDDSIVVWSDAGVSFLQDLRPLVARYLRGSDVAGCRTVMMEGDWSKRDAFVLTDMDFRAVVEGNQIASSLIMARKTPLSLQLAKQWLIHSEDPRIMTEEASVLGFPEYPNYHNNNDDQTAFSLNFKKFGFLAFSTGLRDQYVLLGRNLAKFIANSNAFARGESLAGPDASAQNDPGKGDPASSGSADEHADLISVAFSVAKKPGEDKVRDLSEKLNRGEIAPTAVDTSNQNHYIEAALLRDDDAVRRHRDGSYEI